MFHIIIILPEAKLKGFFVIINQMMTSFWHTVIKSGSQIKRIPPSSLGGYIIQTPGSNRYKCREIKSSGESVKKGIKGLIYERRALSQRDGGKS